MGTWTTLRQGVVLQEEGKPSNSVFLIVHGGADVTSRGVPIRALREGQVRWAGSIDRGGGGGSIYREKGWGGVAHLATATGSSPRSLLVL